MGKVVGAILAGIALLIFFASIATVNGDANLNYASMDEAQQQEYLDKIVKGFAFAKWLNIGGPLKLSQTFADASLDVVSISYKITDPRIERVNASQIQKVRLQLTKSVCTLRPMQMVIEQGVTLRIRVVRPSGAPIMTAQLDKGSCRKYVRN